MRRFSISRFSQPGTLQSRAAAIDVPDEGTIAAERTALVGAARAAAVEGVGGYLAGVSAAIPDVSGGVSVTFEEVYPI